MTEPTEPKKKRFNVVMPMELYRAIRAFAREDDTDSITAKINEILAQYVEIRKGTKQQ